MADTAGIERFRNLTEHKLKPRRHEKFSGLLNHIAKFVFDSTFIHSLKSLAGKKQVKKNEHRVSKYEPFPVSMNDKGKVENLKLVMENMQPKMEKMQEDDVNNIKQQHEISAKYKAAGTGALEKTLDEGNKGSDIVQTQRKKVFIRSRL
ncbi:hypothetical protein FEM48_Zijuj01G0205700 [Ziziphus jujuba var. spinosa]|uniref:Uncharacterized protein n=1 Tax=Ziziphus jujuba var. spinosa TaxID=714518 RepID=A0A978W3E9_ZIZJJ|nr:hypothetical protein FEM48_Zijuj01G0205700 [Ziziphus jujuba var. spinosa]